MTRQKLIIPVIELNWSDWHLWKQLIIDARIPRGIKIPNKISGVYEVKHQAKPQRLTIGKASNLRMRVRQGLVKGKAPHSAGEHIRNHENVSKLEVRWAITDRPSAAEEELHRKHKKQYGKFPKYVKHT